jgi:hypothetical protein
MAFSITMTWDPGSKYLPTKTIVNDLTPTSAMEL